MSRAAKAQPEQEPAASPADVIPAIAELHPAEQSTRAIGAALLLVAEHRSANAGIIDQLKERRAARIKFASPIEIEGIERATRQREIFSEQIDTLETELRTSLQEARLREQDATFAAALSAYLERKSEFASRFTSDYSAAAAVIAGLLAEEVAMHSQGLELVGLAGFARYRGPAIGDGLPRHFTPERVGLETRYRSWPVFSYARLPDLAPGRPAFWGVEGATSKEAGADHQLFTPQALRQMWI